MDYEYDVALSFAGEDREYVDQVAAILKENKIKVFYDKFEMVNLWGKDLGIHFDYVYRKSSRFCIPFISENYKKKVWTHYEIRTAIAKAIETNGEYILPVKFDDTEIDGIRSSLGYIDLRGISPEEFAQIVIEKVKGEASEPVKQNPRPLADIYLGLNAHFTNFGLEPGGSFRVNITNLNREYRYFHEPIFRLTKPFKGNDSLALRDIISPTTFPIKLEYGQTQGVSYMIRPQSLMLWEELPKNTQVKAIVGTTIGESFESNPIEVSQIVSLLKSVKG